MKGKGYTMSATKNQTIERKRKSSNSEQVSPDTTTQEMGKDTMTTKAAEAEMIAQMFIDDSIWTTSNATHTQEMLRRCELFC